MTKEEFLENKGLDEDGFFYLMFKRVWGVLERNAPPEGKMVAYMENLKGQDFFDVRETFQWFFKNGRAINGKTLSGFPTGPEIIERIKIIKTRRISKEASTFKVPEESNKVKAMTDQAVSSEFKRWQLFYVAYPYPDYPVGATIEQCDAIDKSYQDIMRKNGFDPDEYNIRANKLFIRGLLDSMFMTQDNLPYDKKTGEGRPWKDSLRKYKKDREVTGRQEVKHSITADWF